jgi:hypothetical protein
VPREHPDRALLESRGLDWIAAHGMAPDPAAQQIVADTRSHILMSWPTPHAPVPLIQLAVDWCYLFFALDDLRTDTGPTSTDTGRHMSWLYDLTYAQVVPDAPPRSADPFYPAIADLSRRIRAATSPALWRRWVDAHWPVVWSSMWESAQRSRNLTPTFDEYLLARPGLGLGERRSDVRVCVGRRWGRVARRGRLGRGRRSRR